MNEELKIDVIVDMNTKRINCFALRKDGAEVKLTTEDMGRLFTNFLNIITLERP